MADEIVSALNGLSKTTQKLVDGRIAEAEKAEQDRKEQISALNKQIKDGDGRTKEIKEAKAELNQIKVDAKVAKSIKLEVSRSSAAALGISEEELRARLEAEKEERAQTCRVGVCVLRARALRGLETCATRLTVWPGVQGPGFRLDSHG